jgi:hypothetical protein
VFIIVMLIVGEMVGTYTPNMMVLSQSSASMGIHNQAHIGRIRNPQ